MKSTYSRFARAIANCVVLASLLIARSFISSGISALQFLGFLLASGAIMLFGYYIASRHCDKCGESMYLGSTKWFTASTHALFAPFSIPLKCPHCSSETRW
jgi:hypothetical protein